MDTYQLIAIGLYMLLMLAIGYYSYKKSTSNSEEFLLSGRRMGPIITALSAGAADMSGWLLMGLPGAMYVTGFASSWIAIGLTIGALLNYIVVAPRLRVYTERAQNAITIPDYFEKRFKDHSRVLRLISAIVILIFFTLYTSAGMVAGGRLFESAFGMPYMAGLISTSAVVVIYTFMGGFMAVSLTDFVQGTIMVIALIMVPLVVFFQLGGIGSTFETIRSIDPLYLDLFRGTSVVSILSLMAWGLGYFGQPHILVRFMAIDHVRQLKQARNVGISWMVLTVCGALLVGLVGIAYMHNQGQTLDDPETIFIHFAKYLFHPFIGGFLMSAILAAVMSTISSQLLVTSSSMTEDFYKAFLRKNGSSGEYLLISRLSVLFVAIISFVISLSPKDTILDLVGHAWAGFGSAFGPVILLSLLWKRITRNAAITGMVVGGLTVLLWIYFEHPYQEWYAMIPGFLLSFISIVLVSLMDKKPDSKIVEEFHEVEQELKAEYH